RAFDGTELARESEVDLAIARQFAVGVEARAADGGRHIVHVARERAVAFGDGTPVGARLEQRVGAEEITTAELDLVVRQVTEVVERGRERGEVVASLLEDAHRLALGREHVRRSRAAGPRPHDDDIEIRHSTPRRRSPRAVARRPRTRWRATRRARGYRRTR